METYISFQFVALVMLLITVIFYTYKNWISVAKNRIYFMMLLIELVALLINNVLFLCNDLFYGYNQHLLLVSRSISGVFVLFIFFAILKYDLAMVGKILMGRKWWFRALELLVVLCGSASLIPAVLCLGNFHNDVLDRWAVNATRIQSGIAFICLVLAISVVWHARRTLRKRELVVLFGSDLLFLSDVVFERIAGSNNLASYYLIAFMFVIYYMLLHNIDRYRIMSSGCFTRTGFRAVLWEKEQCRENVRCIGICINNIESITNCCSEREIVEIHRQIGALLKKHCGRHYVYHIHSFEYVVILGGHDDVHEAHRALAELIPQYIRLNGKNVSLFCDFYAIDFRDTGYKTGDFFAILTSMRKIAMTYMDRSHLLCYSDESRQDIQKDMEAMRVVNTCISQKNFCLQILPLQPRDERDRLSYEFSICARYGDGELISQELIWEMAAQMGYHQELGEIVFELVCKYVKLKRLQDTVTGRIHVNVEASQISGEEFALACIDLLERYQIPGSFVCLELTVDQDVDYNMLERTLVMLREQGVKVILDQFGVTACNLKTVLNMSFHGVKINHHIVQLYCENSSRQLLYLLEMFATSGWEVILDGVDREEFIAKLEGLRYTCIQGDIVRREFDADRESAAVFQIGGVVLD